MARCEVCFRHCEIEEGGRGACGARTCIGGCIVALNYGCVTSIALDPIEKKPLSRFCPGSSVLSVGSYGCNLFCPFCQNHDISRSKGEGFDNFISPEELAGIAVRYKDRGNIGIAYTYNEPLIGYEFVRDTARIVKDMGMKNILVSNGTVTKAVQDEILPLIDAMNIDIKSMSEKTYKEILGGDLDSVKDFITNAVKTSHVELTMLIVPGMNDTEEEMIELADWISELKDKDGNIIGPKIPLHISRFFPRYKMSDKAPTDVAKISRLVEIACEKLL
ncbi:MAG: AmmeMemoRadiSam system radical SAM enzyme, partial [Clostridiales bacterium]|nr:AmmeMemoRadiSam system radical SAM enzyme [Clostridiales bacterium]